MASCEWADDAAVHLLFSANRWEAVKTLKARLHAGETLVCDRYAFSGVAFTAAKGTLDLEWCKNPDRGLPAPDAVIYLDVTSVYPPSPALHFVQYLVTESFAVLGSQEVARQRGGYGEERYEKEEFQNKVLTPFDPSQPQPHRPMRI
jgi:dTMP kinase